MKNYVEENSYGSDENPKLCFGISFQKIESKNYEYHLHYFADYSEEGDQDIPMVSQDVYDPFRNGPNLDSYEKWNYITNKQTKYIFFIYIIFLWSHYKIYFCFFNNFI